MSDNSNRKAVFPRNPDFSAEKSSILGSSPAEDSSETQLHGSVVIVLLLAFVFLLAPHALFGADDSRERSPRLPRAEHGERIPGQYIVVLNDSVEDADAVEGDIIARVRGERLGSYRSALRGFAARFSETELAEVVNDPRVAFVSEDREVSITDASEMRDSIRVLDTDVRSARRSRWSPPPEQSPSSPPPTAPVSEVIPQLQPLPTGIDRIDAEGSVNTGAGVNVAVIDTGILASHPDLAGQVVGGTNCTTASGGYADQNGHGTHVAGTIAALNNTFGALGVAPGAKLWSVRVLDQNGAGSWSSVICGLDFVTANAPRNDGPIKVANLSLGGGGVSDGNCGNTNKDALHKAICRARDAGVTVVVAAGNSGSNAANFVPAAYDDAVITVSALADSDGTSGGKGSATGYGADDTFASFSNWGTPVDIAAPGVTIYSTWYKGDYKSLSGTSMASPHVAGAAALYIATHPTALWNDVRTALITQGEALGAGHTDPGGKHPEKVLKIALQMF